MTGQPGDRTGRLGVFATVCVFSFLVNFGRIAFAPLVDVFIESGVPEATAGLVATLVWVGGALPRLPTGYLLTKVRRHRVITGMGLGLTAAAGFTAFSPGIRATAVGALLVGVATGVFFIAANPLVSELYPDRVGLAVGIRGMSSQIAAVATPFLVGVAVALGSWRISFGALSGLALLATVGFVLAVRGADMPRAGARDRDLLGAIRAERSLVLAGIVFAGLLGFAWQGVFNFYVTYLGATKGIPRGAAGRLLTLTFAAGIPAFLVAGRLADRFSHLRVLLAVAAGFAVSLLALTVAEGVLAVAVVSVFMGAIVHGLFPATDAYMLDTLPDEHRGSAYAGFSATMMLMQAPGSFAVGAFAQAGIGYDAVFVGYAALVGAVAVGMGGLARAGVLPSGG
jgi:DHA1 family inner membrane transport protein